MRLFLKSDVKSEETLTYAKKSHLYKDCPNKLRGDTKFARIHATT